MSYNIPKTFYAHWPLLRFYIKLTIPCSLAFLAISALGQWCSGRLPHYYDLLFIALIPVIAYIIIAMLILTSDYLYPLKVSISGLVGSNCIGEYCSITWDQIISVEESQRFGLRCLYINTHHLHPILIPLWMHNLDDFCIAIEQCAGKNNPLFIALVAAAHQKR